MKKKLEKQAEERNMIVNKKKPTFFGTEIMPMFIDVYRGSSSEDDDEETQLMKAKVSSDCDVINRWIDRWMDG